GPDGFIFSGDLSLSVRAGQGRGGTANRKAFSLSSLLPELSSRNSHWRTYNSVSDLPLNARPRPPLFLRSRDCGYRQRPCPGASCPRPRTGPGFDADGPPWPDLAQRPQDANRPPLAAPPGPRRPDDPAHPRLGKRIRPAQRSRTQDGRSAAARPG